MVSAKEPNDVWTVDFKGWWRAVNGQRCEPLTVRDAHSRFVLACRLCKASTIEVRTESERLAHERVHRDIAEDVQAYPAADGKAQQRALNRWRQEFNHVRPRQALAGKTPGEVYTPSERRGLRPIVPSYPPHFHPLVVQKNGCLYWRGETYFLSESLSGHHVALELLDGLRAHVWFYQLRVATMELLPDLPEAIYVKKA